ncbi:MAG: molybdenum cofactor guanylyltransferase [Chloroflexi bacterium]|nr:molybdenum cofactor guanylyltransferase [Chloroflexota bacterium]
MIEQTQRVAAAGAVLAGGRSRRMGQDKALLRLAGRTLLERALDTLRSVAQEVLVIGPPERAALAGGARLVPDAFPGTGPLGAIATALQAIQSDRAVLVACDMPFLSAPLLRYLVACSEGYDVTLPRTAAHTEQLHAVYHRACLPAILEQLAAGDLKIDRFFAKVRVRYVDETELRAIDPDLRSLWNLNTPEDWANARRILADRGR